MNEQCLELRPVFNDTLRNWAGDQLKNWTAPERSVLRSFSIDETFAVVGLRQASTKGERRISMLRRKRREPERSRIIYCD